LSDIGHLATILTAVIGHGGQGGIANPIAIQSVSVPPKTPARKTEEKTISSPVLPTPSKLPQFLEHASTNLGIASAPIFESVMHRNGFGPDILHLVEDRDLTDIGMKKGDVIRLKAGAQSWWNGPDARKKRSRADMEATSASRSGSGGFPDFPRELATPPSKKVMFERRYDDGGGAMRFYGPRIKPGSGAKDVFYRCPLRKEFVPIPLGYQCTIEEEYISGDEEAEAEAMDLYNPPVTDNQRRADAAEGLASLSRW
jgi:hypothetical protein